MLDVATSLIPLQQTPLRITDWLRKISEIETFESYKTSRAQEMEKYFQKWFYWISFKDGST